MKGLQEELSALTRAGLARECRAVPAGSLSFSSNDYLNLARDPRLAEAASSAARRHGTGASASRLLGGTTPVHQELETHLALWTQQEAALIFPSGFMANLGVVTALVGPGDAVLLDRLCHASLIDAARLSRARLFVYPHRNLEAAETALKRMRTYRRRLLITESLFSMDGDVAPHAELLDLAHRWGALALVDEAHALGVWGEGGRGLSRGWDVVVGTMSKSLGAQGGFAATSSLIRKLLIQKARAFIYTTGLSPMVAGAALEALRLIRSGAVSATLLQQNARAWRDRIKVRGCNVLDSDSQIVPVWTGTPEAARALSMQLSARGIDAPAIRPPTVPPGECRLRLSFTLSHGEADIDRLLAALDV